MQERKQTKTQNDNDNNKKKKNHQRKWKCTLNDCFRHVCTCTNIVYERNRKPEQIPARISLSLSLSPTFSCLFLCQYNIVKQIMDYFKMIHFQLSFNLCFPLIK